MKYGNQEVGKNIKKRREELGMTQAELAKACGYQSKSSISKIEKGETDLNQTKLAEIAKALQTTPGALFNFEDEREQKIAYKDKTIYFDSKLIHEVIEKAFAAAIKDEFDNWNDLATEIVEKTMLDAAEDHLDDEQKYKLRFSHNLNVLMEQDHINNATLAKMVGVSESAVGKWLSASVMPRPNIQLKIADFFGVERDMLFEKPSNFNKINATLSDNPHTRTQQIPLLGTIAAGAPILAEEHIEEYIALSVDVKADFALRVRGDSMIDANIFDGDIVFIHQQPTVENGEIAAVMLIDPVTSDAVATLKRVYQTPNGMQLVPENRNYAPIIVNEDNYEGAKILGKATYYITEAR